MPSILELQANQQSEINRLETRAKIYFALTLTGFVLAIVVNIVVFRMHTLAPLGFLGIGIAFLTSLIGGKGLSCTMGQLKKIAPEHSRSNNQASDAESSYLKTSGLNQLFFVLGPLYIVSFSLALGYSLTVSIISAVVSAIVYAACMYPETVRYEYREMLKETGDKPVNGFRAFFGLI